MSSVEMKYVLITPQMAKEWLSTSKGNPRWKSNGKMFDKRIVSRIKNDIESGKWYPSSSTIAFDEFGHLIDGHHRLTAISMANKPCESFVVTGVSEEALAHIDENKPRSVAQRTGLDTQIVAIVNAHLYMLRGANAHAASAEEVLTFCDEHPQIETAFSLTRQGAHSSVCKRGYVGHAALCALECGVREEVVARFCIVANTGFVDNEFETAAIVARNMQLNQHTVGSTWKIPKFDAVIQSAIYDFEHFIPRRRPYTSQKAVYFEKLAKQGARGYVRR